MRVRSYVEEVDILLSSRSQVDVLSTGKYVTSELVCGMDTREEIKDAVHVSNNRVKYVLL